MDIDNTGPNRPNPKRSRKKPAPKREQGLEIHPLDEMIRDTGLAIIQNQGRLTMLTVLASEMEESEMERLTPIEGRKLREPGDNSLQHPELHHFFSNQEPPKIYEMKNILDHVNFLNQSVRELDDTDLSGKTFKDCVDEIGDSDFDKKIDILSNDLGLLKELETNLETESPYILECYNTQGVNIGELEAEKVATRISGENSSPEEIKEIQKQIGDTNPLNKLEAFLTTEKLRASILALSPENGEERRKNKITATKVCGEHDFELLEAQTLFLTEKLKDLRKENPSKSGEEIVQGLDASDLLCPEIKSRIQDGNLSEEQKDALIRPVKFYLENTGTKSEEERKTQIQWFTISTYQVLEEGRINKNTETMKHVLLLKKENLGAEKGVPLSEKGNQAVHALNSCFLAKKIQEWKKKKEEAEKKRADIIAKETPEEKKIREEKEKKEGLGKKVAGIMGKSSKAIILGGGVMLIKQQLTQQFMRVAMDNDGRQYGKQEELVAAMEKHGVNAMDQAM